jgi:hypothetical protein
MVVLWIIRFFVFRLYESPKYLMGRGRFAEAVEVVHAVAKYNGKTTNLTTAELEAAGIVGGNNEKSQDTEAGAPVLDTSTRAALRRKFAQFNGDHVRALFVTRKLAISTSLVIIIWGAHLVTCLFIGLTLLVSYHWACVPSVQRFCYLLPCDSRGGLWRRLGLYHLS